MLLASCLLIIIPFIGYGQAPKILPITVQGKEGAATLRFIYCPKGELLEVSKDLKPTTTKEIKPFYFLETEVTIAEYRAILGQSGVGDISSTVDKIDAETKGSYKNQMDKKDSLWPAPFVNLKNALEICKVANESFTKKDPKKTRSLDAYFIRLPTSEEWQYAGRATTNKEDGEKQLHFNRWISANDVQTPDMQAGTELRKKLNLLGTFDGGQSQALDMIEKSTPYPNEIRKLANSILGLAFSKDNQLDGWIRPDTGQIILHDVKFLNPNAWGIYGVHFNTPEFVFIQSNPIEATKLTEEYANGTKNIDSIKGAFTLAGPYSGAALSGYRDFSSFTLSGFQYIPNRKTPNIDDLCFEATTGVRLVMDRQLSKDYVSILRENWHNAIYNLTKETATMDEKEKILKELSSQGDESDLIYQVYKALGSYTQTDKKNYSASLVTVGAKWGQKKISFADLDLNPGDQPKPNAAPTLAEEGAFFSLFSSR